jgi:membrane protein YdbS with pleckstrin-like domain
VTTDGEARRLDPRILTVWRLGALTSFGVPLTISGAVATLALDVPLVVVAASAALLLGLAIGPLPGLRWRRWSWTLTGTGIELTSGVLVHRRVTLPFFRIQQIDVIEGPLERLLGLATLTVTTASAGGVSDTGVSDSAFSGSTVGSRNRPCSAGDGGCGIR